MHPAEAQHVILTEPLLDPAVEAQAVGRVHRIGQTQPTFVHRYVGVLHHKVNVHVRSMLLIPTLIDVLAIIIACSGADCASIRLSIHGWICSQALPASRGQWPSQPASCVSWHIQTIGHAIHAMFTILLHSLPRYNTGLSLRPQLKKTCNA